MAVDPVCKKEVDEKNPPGGKVRCWDAVFYFCAAECRKEFRRDPDKYAADTVEKRGPSYSKLPDDWRT